MEENEMDDKPIYESELEAPKMKALATPAEALAAAPTVHEVLARPAAYDEWYKGIRMEALHGQS